jgi:hypothetical protein
MCSIDRLTKLAVLSVATLAPDRRENLAPLVAELAQRAIAVAPGGHVALDDHDLYLSHLALGGRR